MESNTKPTRINSEQEKTIRDAAPKMELSFQQLLFKVIRVGINVMRLEEKK